MTKTAAFKAGPAVAAGVVSLGIFVVLMITNTRAPDNEGSRAPLYWVAPMDPSYRRDRPGKSPMGMDLVPVYEERSTSQAPGTLQITSSVVNSLGVRTREVAERPLSPTLRTVGFVRWDEDRLIHEHPRVAGWIEKLFVKAVGDPVRRGAPLYSLYSPDLVNAQEELLLALRRGDSALEQAARQRLSSLKVPAELIDDIERQGRVFQTVTFMATMDGIVDELPIREGFYVEPRTTLMAIGSLDSVWVEASVLERQTDFVRPGMLATLAADYLPGRRWEGRIDYIYPSLDTATRTLRLRLRFDNPDRALRPNMFTSVTLKTQQTDPVPAVPREAVIRTAAGDRVVLALGNGRYRSVPVTLGAHDEAFFEVRSGLKPGDVVVTSAQFLIDSESNQSAGLQRISSTPESHPGQRPVGVESVANNPRQGAMQHDAMDHGAMHSGAMEHGAMDHGTVHQEHADHNSADEAR